MLARFYKDRRRAQAGTTLVELLVSVVIMGFALTIIVGTLSTGLLDATLAKRNVAAEAVVRYELEKVAAGSPSPSSYSECFATESPDQPAQAASYQGDCPPGPFTLRADVVSGPGTSPTSQIWTVTVLSWPSKSQIGSPVQQLRGNR